MTTDLNMRWLSAAQKESPTAEENICAAGGGKIYESDFLNRKNHPHATTEKRPS